MGGIPIRSKEKVMEDNTIFWQHGNGVAISRDKLAFGPPFADIQMFMSYVKFLSKTKLKYIPYMLEKN